MFFFASLAFAADSAIPTSAACSALVASEQVQCLDQNILALQRKLAGIPRTPPSSVRKEELEAWKLASKAEISDLEGQLAALQADMTALQAATAKIPAMAGRLTALEATTARLVAAVALLKDEVDGTDSGPPIYFLLGARGGSAGLGAEASLFIEASKWGFGPTVFAEGAFPWGSGVAMIFAGGEAERYFPLQGDWGIAPRVGLGWGEVGIGASPDWGEFTDVYRGPTARVGLSLWRGKAFASLSGALILTPRGDVVPTGAVTVGVGAF